MIDEKYISDSIKKIMLDIPDMSQEVLEKRFGLKKGEKRHTLDAIGQGYGITRERVRQIENSAKQLILSTKELVSHTQKVVRELEKVINGYGGVVAEKDLLGHFTDNVDYQDHLHFILNLSEPFLGIKKTDFRDKIWCTDEDSYSVFEKSLDQLYRDLDSDELLTEKEILSRFTDKLSQQTDNKKLLKNDTVKRLISLSKKIGSNKLDQWGRADSRNISTKGVKDLAYLILNEVGKPLHFREITDIVSERFGQNINVATMHNELIKDERFILVGRGQYGLSTWKKFSGGTVKEVIKEVLKDAKKPLTKEEIIYEVLEKKNVRKQTVVINLSSKDFKKNKEGKYVIFKK